MDPKPNIDLGKTQITDKIRVSSAAIFYEEWFGKRYQFETFIFSNDKEAIRTKQIIHGSDRGEFSEKLAAKTRKIHNYISNNLLQKFNINP